MKKTILNVLAIGSLLVVALPGQEIAGRKATQQARIAKGVKSGQLTPHETADIERNERNINRETRAERAVNGGPLTPREHRQVNRQQNRVSRQIYRDKHNAVTK